MQLTDQEIKNELYLLDKTLLNEWEQGFAYTVSSQKAPLTPKQRKLATGILAKPLPVRCANCGKVQPDQGTRKTCEHCGCMPLPSYSYPKDSSFYPKPKRQPK